MAGDMAFPTTTIGQPVINYGQVRVGVVVRKGETFSYVFDFGDNWRPRCRVTGSSLNPVEVAGIVPERPIPVWGWGSIPDQYGRRWEDDTRRG